MSGQPKGGGSSVDTFGFNLSGGADDYAVTVGELDSAYEEFADAETVDVNLIMGGTTPAGANGTTHATNLIDLAEKEKMLLFSSLQEEKMLLTLQTLPHKLQMSRTFLMDFQVHHTQSLIVDTSTNLINSMTYSDLYH